MSDRTCASCEYSRPYLNGSGHRACAGPQRERVSIIGGIQTVPATCEYERFWLWRWLGANTCGPEGNYWHPRVERPRPPPPMEDR